MSSVILETTRKPERQGLPWGVTIAGIWLAAMLALGLLAPIISPYGYTALDLKARLSLPFEPRHWLGTDELGRDVLSRLLTSIRISLLIAFGATAISATFGTLLGFLAAHFRGLVEQAVLVLADFSGQHSLPDFCAGGAGVFRQ